MAVAGANLDLGGGRGIGAGHPCFIIAEIGQNHQGDLDTAKRMILEAKNCGVDCVKFQKTCISEKFNQAALERSYAGPNSWGTTYGEHKKYLEFDDNQFKELQNYAKQNDILFSASAMDEVSVDKLFNMSVPFIKIGSGDSNNIPMIEYAASKNIPLIISTGMIDKKFVEKIYSSVKEYHLKFCLLHCVSSYPAPYTECNLNVIKDYQASFPDVCVGYSGHEIGISVSLAAVALGAKVLERHFTLDKTQKGSDHCCSLLPSEMNDLVRQVRIVESCLGDSLKKITPSEKSCMDKLLKSLCVANSFKKGHILQKRDIKIKVTGPKGIDAAHYERVIGGTLSEDKAKDEPIFETDLL